MAITWIVFIVYMVAMVVIGFLVSRKQKNANVDDYFVSRNSLPPLVVAFSIVATGLSGSPFLGIPGNVFKTGLGIWVAGCAVGGAGGTLLANLVLAKPMRRFSETHSATTIIEILEGIFQDRRLRIIAIPIILFGSIYFAVVNWVSIGNLLSGMLGIDFKMAILVGLLVVVLYSVLGGNNATAKVAVAQTFIALFASLYLAFLALHVSGGLTQLTHDVAEFSPGHLNVAFGALPTSTFISFILLYAFGVLGQPHSAIKYVQIKDPKMFPKMMMFAVWSHVLTIVFIPLLGLTMFVQVSKGLIPTITATDTITPLFISLFANPAVGGLLIAATLSAIMSTGIALILTASSTIVKDIMVNIIHIDCSGKKGIRYSQLAMVACMIISGWMSLDPGGDIVSLGAAAWGIFAAVFAAPMVLGLRWRRASKEGAFIGMLISGVFILAVNFLKIFGIWAWPMKLDAGAFAMAINFVIMITVSLFTKPAQRDFLPTPLSELKQRNAVG